VIDVQFQDRKAVGNWYQEFFGCNGAVTLTKIDPQAKPSSVYSPSLSEIRQRLVQVEELLEERLITETEAAEKRRQILDDL